MPQTIFHPESPAKLVPKLADAPAVRAQPTVPLQQHGVAPGYSWAASQTTSIDAEVAKLDGPAIVVLPHERPDPPESKNGPTFIKAGTGGKRVRMPRGNVVTCGGEVLRLALSRGGEIIGEEPIKGFHRPVNQHGQNI